MTHKDPARALIAYRDAARAFSEAAFDRDAAESLSVNGQVQQALELQDSFKSSRAAYFKALSEAGCPVPFDSLHGQSTVLHGQSTVVVQKNQDID